MRRLPALLSIVFLTSALAASAGFLKWKRTISEPGPRGGFGMAADPQGTLYVFGGNGVGKGLNDMWVYKNGVWTEAATSPGEFEDVEMVYDTSRGKVVVFGGKRQGNLMNETWEFNGTNWNKGPTAPVGLVARRQLAMAYMPGVGTVLYGGRDAGGNPLDDTWIYDGSAWTKLAVAGPGFRRSHRMVYDATQGLIVLFGGRSVGGLLNDTWEFNGTKWQAGAPTPPSLRPRGNHAMAYLPNVGTVVYGGDVGAISPVNEIWIYDGNSWTNFTNIPGSLQGRSDARMVEASGVLYFFGGNDLIPPPNRTYYDDMWTFDGTTLTQVTPTTPSGRVDTAMASTGTEMVLFGGRPSPLPQPMGGTWLYDGVAWTKAPTTGIVPPDRYGHAMAYDVLRDRVVLFGGIDGVVGHSNETWEFNPVAGTWALGPAAPPLLLPRAYTAMAYDNNTGLIVLVGGETSAGVLLNDVWSYNGVAWTQEPLPPPGLTPRSHHAMSYHSGTSSVVLFGGSDSSGPRNDTWLRTGSTWTAGPAAPAGLVQRQDHGMAYFGPYDEVILLGGGDGVNFFGDAWGYNGSGWVSAGPPPGDFTPRQDILVGSASGFAAPSLVVYGGDDLEYLRDTFELGTSAGNDFLLGAALVSSNPNQVRLFTAAGTGPVVDFFAYQAGAYGNVVAGTDLDAVPFAEILTGAGPGPIYGPQVRGFHRDGAIIPNLNFFAYGTLRFGVNVIGGDSDGDAMDEIVTGAGPGAVFGPHVRGWNFDNVAIAPLSGVNFFAYKTLKWGVNTATGEVDIDGFVEVLSAPGPGIIFGPQVRGWNVDGGPVASIPGINFNAFATLQYGANAAAGDTDGDDFAEIAAAPGPGAALANRYRGFDHDLGGIQASPGFDVSPFTTMYGGRVALGDLGGIDISADLVAGEGPDPAASTNVMGYTYDGASLSLLPASFPGFSGVACCGVNVATGGFGY